ncbi:hypothetical protein NUS44_07360 [Glaesserella parasuis]|nr:hypothetical protein [Glaesserella parasuis]
MQEVLIPGLKRYMDFIFTYEKYSELNIEKTIDHLEGLFRKLEWKSNNHKGLTKSITRCL